MTTLINVDEVRIGVKFVFKDVEYVRVLVAIPNLPHMQYQRFIMNTKTFAVTSIFYHEKVHQIQ